MKFSICGTGFILPRHIRAIKSINGEILDVTSDPDHWKAMIKNTKADCIVILTPNDLHFEMVMEAVKYNKVVLCEKPLVIKSEHIEILAKKPNIFTVLQLRHHPLAKELKKNIKKNKKYHIYMDISVYRDKKYFESWKAQKERSGGILFNLGIHFFDLLLYLFGDPIESGMIYCDEKEAKGWIEGNNYSCIWKMSLIAKKDKQHRIFRINGKTYNFSSKENLSFEGFHEFIYQDLIKGKGFQPKDTIKATKLIENLYG